MARRGLGAEQIVSKLKADRGTDGAGQACGTGVSGSWRL